MKKINFIKFALDLIMGVVFALLFNKSVLGGMSFHEIAGLAIGFAVLIHILLNLKWVKNVTLSIFNKKLALKTRIGYVLNILLLVDMAIIIISGIFISKTLFPTLRMQSSFFNQMTHISASYLALAIIGIHVGLHWKWVMNVFKKLVHINNENKILGYVSKALTVVVLAFGIYSMISVNYFSNTVQMFGAAREVPFEQNKGTRPDSQLQQPPQNNNGTSDSVQQGNITDSQRQLPENFKEGRGIKPGFPGGDKGMKEGRGKGSASIPSLLASNLSILGVFAIVTYYIEKLILRKKNKMN